MFLHIYRPQLTREENLLFLQNYRQSTDIILAYALKIIMYVKHRCAMLDNIDPWGYIPDDY
jgi:hypothetical protein